MPVLNAVGCTVPAEPSALAKNPSFSPTRAEACVTLVRKPSLTVTGDASEVVVLPLPELAVLDEDEEQPARSRAAPIITANAARRIE